MALSDPMLLTHPPPAKSEFDFRAPHEFVLPAPPHHKRLSPKVEHDFLPPFSASLVDKMSGPHRGLPPAASLTLPDPSRMGPPLTGATSFTGMPPPPSQWPGSEESMRHWLVTKAEEEKRRQEEERSRQEHLRLEQRKIEQSMLQESIRNGVPPPLVPMIFAGIGGHNLASINIDLLQQYAAQFQVAQQQLATQQQQQQSQGSPEGRRDSRLLVQASAPPYAASAGQQVVPSGQAAQGLPPPPPFGPYPSGMMSPSSTTRPAPGATPSAAPRPPLGNLLPRLTTNEAQVQPIASSQSGPPAPSHSAPQESSSPSIYFHHWVPPTTQAAGGNPPATPSEYTSSPRKRKATGGHPPAPAPTSAPQTSPSFSYVSSSSSTPGRRGGHYRTRSDASTRASDAPGRPTTSSSRAESSGHVELEMDRLRRPHQQQPFQPRGGFGGDDRSESSSQHSSTGASARYPRQAPGSERGSAPVSPRREGGAAARSRGSSISAPRPP